MVVNDPCYKAVSHAIGKYEHGLGHFERHQLMETDWRSHDELRKGVFPTFCLHGN